MKRNDRGQPDEIVMCADCGFRYMRALLEDEREHRRHHDEAIDGPKTKFNDGCHIINMKAPKRVRELAARVAILAKRDARYDYPAYRADDNEENTVALIMVIRGHVVGLVISRERRCQQRASLESLRHKNSGTPVQSTVRCSIEMIWVLRKHSKPSWQGVMSLAKRGVGDGRLIHFQIESLRRDFGLQGTIFADFRVQERRREKTGQTWGVSAWGF